MVDVADFEKFVVSYVSGVPYGVVIQKLVEAAIEFCEETEYWRYSPNDIDAVADQINYTITIPSDSQISTIVDPIYHSKHKVFGKEKRWLDENILDIDAGIDWTTDTDDYAKYFLIETSDLTTIRLIPYPNTSATGALQLTVILKPTRDATTLPDFFYNEFAQGL